jgi:aryl-alcohol dehydrogenase-like predicted oxidoreductase
MKALNDIVDSGQVRYIGATLVNSTFNLRSVTSKQIPPGLGMAQKGL